MLKAVTLSEATEAKALCERFKVVVDLEIYYSFDDTESQWDFVIPLN